MKLPYILLFFFVILSSSLAQNPRQKVKPIDGKEANSQLSEGTLIVRLSRCEHNIEMTRALEGEEKAQQEKERIDQASINLIKEFEKDYSFSDVVFSYDVELYKYLQDSMISIFLNEQLKIDPSIKIKLGPVFILASYSNKVFQLHDKDLNLIGKPSPQYITRHFNRKYQFAVAKTAQSFSELFTRKKPVTNFNRKLFFHLNHYIN